MQNPKVGSTVVFGAAFTFLSFAIALLDYKSKVWGYIMCAFTLAALLYGFVQMGRLPYSWTGRLRAFWSLRFGGRMPLSVASKLAYEEARAKGTFWAEAAERLAVSRTPNGVLDYVATYFGMEVPIWGTRPPSDRLERIPSFSARRGSIEDGATRLVVRDNASTEYINLEVRSKDVRRVIAVMATKVFKDGSK